ncbi:MAG: NifB/NifX family molybdenum-iron cluster-binding protein [Syntrophotaleaceae bacterium]
MTDPKYREISLRIAIPSNGRRIMPRFGLARDFFLVDIKDDRLSNLRACRWEPALEPSVARWLHRLKVDGVICDGIHPRFQSALKAEGLWVFWGIWGDIDDVLRRFLEGGMKAPAADGPTPPVPCCENKNRRCRTPVANIHKGEKD